MFSDTAQVSRQGFQFFVRPVCLFVRVTVVDKNRAVVCCLLGNCGIPWVNCAVICVKDDWKRQFWGLGYCLSKLRNLFIFSVRY